MTARHAARRTSRRGGLVFGFIAPTLGGAATDAQASWGKFIEMVEKYTPAEYYKDDKMFDDASGIKDYFKRFFVRPFKNFFTGSTELDPEYSVKQEDVESD